MNKRRQSPANNRPFSRLLDIDDVPEGGLDVRIEATPEERIAIAKESRLLAVGSLVADYRIERRPGGRLAVHGELRAGITQICVVSLESFESDKIQAIDVAFAPEVPSTPPKAHGRRREARGSNAGPTVVPVGNDQNDPPDPIIDKTIDLGAVALEFLTLAQDLYPRRPGVQFTDMVVGETPEEIPSAFAALGRLKDGL